MLPKYRRPTHPGEILSEEFLRPLGISQTKLAAHLGWAHAKINEIVNGKRGVTAETALAFSDAFGTSAEFWINLQMNYDLWEAQQEHKRRKKIA
ncbi:MAG: HigA family addiction module antidote protein [Bdellovibrionales bacterium]|nr:HigA family addiction module antidote protein [Bdellovibrionales bacterium]